MNIAASYNGYSCLACKIINLHAVRLIILQTMQLYCEKTNVLLVMLDV